jgi:hypothetical protein
MKQTKLFITSVLFSSCDFKHFIIFRNIYLCLSWPTEEVVLLKSQW